MTFYSVVVALLFILKLCKTTASFFNNLLHVSVTINELYM